MASISDFESMISAAELEANIMLNQEDVNRDPAHPHQPPDKAQIQAQNLETIRTALSNAEHADI